MQIPQDFPHFFIGRRNSVCTIKFIKSPTKVFSRGQTIVHVIQSRSCFASAWGVQMDQVWAAMLVTWSLKLEVSLGYDEVTQGICSSFSMCQGRIKS